MSLLTEGLKFLEGYPEDLTPQQKLKILNHSITEGLIKPTKETDDMINALERKVEDMERWQKQ